jgi:nucleotide-binding universal stress UspA family protein
MEKIVCLVDLEGSSDSALEYAAHIARASKRELVLLNAVAIPVLQEALAETLGNESPVPALVEESRNRLEPFRKLVEKEFGIKCRVQIQADYLDMDKGLAEEVKAGKYKLVVMGRRSAESFRQFITGVHSEHLLKTISAPLLVVPEGLEFRHPKDVIYATDYESDDAYVVKLVVQLLQGYDPQVTVMHVSQSDTRVSHVLGRSMRNELEAQLDGMDLKFERAVDPDVVSGIHGFMKKRRYDMLVMLAKNYSLTEKLFGRHIIEQVNRITVYPILVIHAPQNDLSADHKGIVF